MKITEIFIKGADKKLVIYKRKNNQFQQKKIIFVKI